MSDKVTTLPCITTLDIPPDKVIEPAIGKLRDVVIAGWDHEGNLYLASSLGRVADTLLLLEIAKKELMERV